MMIEEVIYKKWAEILGVSESSVIASENLFEIGGDSLKLSQLLADIETYFQVEIQVEELYENPTLETFVHLIRLELDKKELDDPEADEIEEGEI